MRFKDTVGWKEVISKTTRRAVSVDNPAENAALIKAFDEYDWLEKK